MLRIYITCAFELDCISFKRFSCFRIPHHMSSLCQKASQRAPFDAINSAWRSNLMPLNGIEHNVTRRLSFDVPFQSVEEPQKTSRGT